MLNDVINHDEALETFAVSVWREADSCADSAGWSRAYERLWGVQMYLTLLRQYPAANTANELKAIAAQHSGRHAGFIPGQYREPQTIQAQPGI